MTRTFLSGRLLGVLLLLAFLLAAAPLAATAQEAASPSPGPALLQAAAPPAATLEAELVAQVVDQVLATQGGTVEGGLPPWVVPASGGVNVLLVLTVIWLRESSRREYAARVASDQRRDQELERMAKLVADTREAYATKAELRHIEQRIDDQFRGVTVRMERVEGAIVAQGTQVAGVATDVKRLVDFLKPTT